MDKEKVIDIVKTICDEYYNSEMLGSAVSSLAHDIINQINNADRDDADAYCKENCKGYRDTGGKCFVDGRCKAYIENKKKYMSITEANKAISSAMNKFSDMLDSGKYTREECYAYLTDEHKRIKESVDPLYKETIDYSFLYPDQMRSFTVADNNYMDGYVSFRGKRSIVSVVDQLKEFKFGEKVKVKIIKNGNNN